MMRTGYKKDLAMRNRITETTVIETTMSKIMSDIPQGRVSNVLGQIKKSVDARHAFEIAANDGNDTEVSKDFVNVANLHNATVARFFIAVGIVPEYYINSPSYDDVEAWSTKSKLPSDCKTRNLKAYKKMSETARYFADGGKLESVVKTFVACAILSAQHMTVIPRDVCERFLSSVPLSHVSEELVEALDHYRAKHMTGGASTQTSQATLQLATMRAATVVRNGRNKDFSLDVHSPVIVSFAERFNLTAQLERAQKFRATVIAETVELASEESVSAE